MISYEWNDDLSTGDRTIIIKLSAQDMASANLTSFDHMLFDDIQNGEPSNTPLADQLLGLESLVRRIEEASLTQNTKNGETECGQRQLIKKTI